MVLARRDAPVPPLAHRPAHHDDMRMKEVLAMAVRDRLRKGAAQYLEPGEQIQAVFYAKRPAMQYNDRAVVATDRRLLLLELNFLGRVTGLVGEASRGIKLGPCHGFMHS